MKRLTLIAAALMLTAALRAQTPDSVLVVDLPDGQRLEMVWVEGGTFTMGSNDARGVSHHYESTRPEHRVTVSGFYMARYEVTQGVWKAVKGDKSLEKVFLELEK